MKLSGVLRVLLEVIDPAHERGVTLDKVSDDLFMHKNHVREAMKCLESAGLVQKIGKWKQPEGPGGPCSLWGRGPKLRP